MSNARRSESTLSEPAEMRGEDTVTCLEISLDMLETDAANDDVPEESGRFPAYAASLSDIEVLLDEDLDEVPADDTVTIGDADIEVLDPPRRAPMLRQVTNETVLIYCKPGDTLPPYAIPTGELPRFAVKERRPPLPRFDVMPPSVNFVRRLPPARLPRFEFDATPARNVPPVRLPRFPIAEPGSVRGALPGRLPGSMRVAAQAPAHSVETCPHCRHLALVMLGRAV